MAVAGGKGTGEMTVYTNGYRVSVLKMKKILVMGGGDGCRTM